MSRIILGVAAGIFIALGLFLITNPIDKQPHAPLTLGDVLPGLGAILAGVLIIGLITWSTLRKPPASVTRQILDLAKADSSAPASGYHRIIIAAGLVCFASTVALLTASLIALGPDPWLEKPLGAVMFVILGTLLGIALACTFAPSSFLNGPTGQKWLDFIGTRNVLAARAVCVVVTVLLGAFFAFALWAFLIDGPKKQRARVQAQVRMMADVTQPLICGVVQA
jgi:hypothetical protein